MNIFILLYTLTLDGRTTTTNLEFTSLSECMREKDRVEQFYFEEPTNEKHLEITCKSIGAL